MKRSSMAGPARDTRIIQTDPVTRAKGLTGSAASVYAAHLIDLTAAELAHVQHHV